MHTGVKSVFLGRQKSEAGGIGFQTDDSEDVDYVGDDNDAHTCTTDSDGPPSPAAMELEQPDTPCDETVEAAGATAGVQHANADGGAA